MLSGAPGGSGAPQRVPLVNADGPAHTITQLEIRGPGAAAFEVVEAPPLPLTLEAGQNVEVALRLREDAPAGIWRATLGASGPSVTYEAPLTGLQARGRGAGQEPPLSQIAEALDSGAQVGPATLDLGSGPGPVGDEVAAPLFERAGPGPVEVRPVARYGQDGDWAYGAFTAAGTSPVPQPLGTLTSGDDQRLLPPAAAGSARSFDPGEARFGLYVTPGNRPVYSAAALQGAPWRHAARVYPLRGPDGQVQAGGYLVAFERGDDADYQDAVFTVHNVRPAPALLAYAARSPAPATLYEGQGGVLGGQLYVFGGFDRIEDGQPLATTAARAYDPAADRWRTLRPMPEPLTHAGQATDGQGILYLAGGFLGDHPGPQTDHVWRYEARGDAWSALPPLPQARGAGALALSDRTLHYFGGTLRSADGAYLRDTGDHWTLNLDDPRAWRVAAPLPNPRNHLGGVALGGVVYAVGGQHLGQEDAGNQTDVHAYSPATDTWRRVAPLPLPLGHITASTLAFQGRLMVVGGVTQGARASDAVLEYDPIRDRWTRRPALPSPRQSPVAGDLGTSLLVTGGSTGAGPTTTTVQLR